MAGAGPLSVSESFGRRRLAPPARRPAARHRAARRRGGGDRGRRRDRHRPSARDDKPGAEEAVEALRNSIGQLASEIKALKAGVGEGSRVAASGLATIESRLDGAEHAQATLNARIASLSETLASAPPPVSPEITGSIASEPPPVARDWVLWRVRNGRALVQGKGGYFEVAPGSSLPGPRPRPAHRQAGRPLGGADPQRPHRRPRLSGR